MRLISAGSLVRAQSGPFLPVFAYYHVNDAIAFYSRQIHSKTGLHHLLSNYPGKDGRALSLPFRRVTYDAAGASIRPLKTGNTQTARDQSRETVLARETLTGMPGFEYVPAAKRDDR